MNFKAIGLVVVLGVSLTGCSGETATDDLRTCSDAKYAMGSNLQKYLDVLGQGGYILRLDYAKDLRDLTDRNISSKLSSALFSDAMRIETTEDVFDTPEVSDFCNTNFPDSY
jgi:hypothetical protein